MAGELLKAAGGLHRLLLALGLLLGLPAREVVDEVHRASMPGDWIVAIKVAGKWKQRPDALGGGVLLET